MMLLENKLEISYCFVADSYTNFDLIARELYRSGCSDKFCRTPLSISHWHKYRRQYHFSKCLHLIWSDLLHRKCIAGTAIASNQFLISFRDTTLNEWSGRNCHNVSLSFLMRVIFSDEILEPYPFSLASTSHYDQLIRLQFGQQTSSSFRFSPWTRK